MRSTTRIILFSLLLSLLPGMASAQEPAHARFQAELAKNKGRLVIPAGDYRFDGTVDVDLAKLGTVSIRGDGPVTITMAAAGPAFRITGTHGGTASPAHVKPEVWRQNMPRIEDLEIVGGHPEATGIELRQTMQATVSRLAVRKALHGIHLTDRNRNIIISDCHLYQNTGIGIFLDDLNLHQVNIANCHVSYNQGGGIVVRDGQVRNLHITGCDIEANMPEDDTPTTTANVLIDQSTDKGGNSVAEVAITGCTIQHSAHWGKTKRAPGGANIRILGNDRHQVNMVTITGNILSDTTTHVHLRKVMDVTLTGNSFFTTEPTDLLVEESTRVVMTGNVFNPREEKAVGGIVLRNSSHCLLSGATMHNLRAEDGAILLENCRACRLTQCILSDCRKGIVLRNCRQCVVSDCTVTGLPEAVEAVHASGDDNVIRNILRIAEK